MDGWVDGRMDGSINIWMDGWMDGWIEIKYQYFGYYEAIISSITNE